MTENVAAPELSFLEFGDAGDPPLFLVHGLYGNAASMVPLAETFAGRGLRAIAVDALGHGSSPAPDGFTLADSGTALDALIARLGYDSAAVIGISMGSYVAAQAAILEPSRISKLVLVVTKGQGATSSVVAYAQRNGFDLANATMEQMLDFMAGALWSPHTPQERRAELLAQQGSDPQQELSTEGRAAVDRSLADFDLRPGLPSITAQTLVISGRSDGLNPPEVGQEVAELIPGARFEVYENSGHMLASEETDRLVDEVTELVPRSMTGPVPFEAHPSGAYLHGTRADLQVGDLLEAGRVSNYGGGRIAGNIYVTQTLDAAAWGAELAVGDGPMRIYIVEPTGELEDDPNVTDKKFPGNPTRSFRSKQPVRVIGELLDWEGHSPEQIQTMRDGLERLRREGRDVIYD